MAKYLVRGSYTSESAKGLLKDGGSARRAAVEAELRHSKRADHASADSPLDRRSASQSPDGVEASGIRLTKRTKRGEKVSAERMRPSFIWRA